MAAPSEHAWTVTDAPARWLDAYAIPKGKHLGVNEEATARAVPAGAGKLLALPTNWAGAVIDVTDDQSVRREDQNGHVAPKFVTIKGGLVVNDVTENLFAAKGSIKSLANNLRVVAASLNIGAQRHART